MNFNLKKPCEHCPFRNDIQPFLTGPRAEEIVECITDQQGTFPCHKTTIDDGEDGDLMAGPKSEHCAGVLIMLEKMEQPNQMMRISERLGMYDRTKLDMNAPVFEDGDEFIDAQYDQGSGTSEAPDKQYDDIE